MNSLDGEHHPASNVDRNPLTELTFQLFTPARAGDVQRSQIPTTAITRSRAGGTGENRLQHGGGRAAARALARGLPAWRGTAEVLPGRPAGRAAAGEGAGKRRPAGLQE